MGGDRAGLTRSEVARLENEAAGWLEQLAEAAGAAPWGAEIARQRRAVAMELEMEAAYLCCGPQSGNGLCAPRCPVAPPPIVASLRET